MTRPCLRCDVTLLGPEAALGLCVVCEDLFSDSNFAVKAMQALVRAWARLERIRGAPGAGPLQLPTTGPVLVQVDLEAQDVAAEEPRQVTAAPPLRVVRGGDQP